MFKTFVVTFLFVAIVVCFYLLAKNENTCRMRIVIIDAIRDYKVDMYEKGLPILVDYTDKEPYYSTLFRLWDWGYTRILPPEKFKIIEPYIVK